ncbi:MAG: light-harvesting chlorophyll a/b-binding protein Lhcb4 [Monoraphidium minutum]|nr:MAG: light-harvesting chlorophyll a/b-binding protein Lhcb4 [Monoraphidium minutum]
MRTVQVQAKKAGTKKTAAASGSRKGGAGYRKFDGDALWLPNTERPGWLDGSLPGDRGFDPLGLSRPSDFVQIGVDENNINNPKNNKGDVEGRAAAVADVVDAATSLSPYSEVFGLQRFRETEVIHGRWAMLGVLGALVAEGATGIKWYDAIGAELVEPKYWGLDLPWSINTAAVFNSLLMGGVEVFRNTQLEPEKRCYPGGFFDPLNFADEANPERAFQLKTAEIKHGRLAMVAALGFLVQAGVQQEGALGSLAKFGGTF